MCGIAGAVNWADAECMERMVAVQHHRGPDDGGTWWERALLLAAALLLIKPGYVTDAIGLALLGVVLAAQWRPKPVSET